MTSPAPTPDSPVITRAMIAAACQAQIRRGDQPGVVGDTTPAAARAVACALVPDPGQRRPAWPVQRIEAWRDHAIDNIRDRLLGGAGDAPDTAERIAEVGLGLCDVRVRDVLMLDLILTTEQQRAEADARLWPVVTGLPAAVRAPAGSILASLEYTLGQPVEDLLRLATEADPDYRLAELVGALSHSQTRPGGWLAAMRALTYDEVRAAPGWHVPHTISPHSAWTAPGQDPLGQAPADMDPAAALASDLAQAQQAAR